MAFFSAVSAMMSFAHGSCRQTEHYSAYVSAIARPNQALVTTRRGGTTIARGVATELPPLMVPAEVDIYDSTEKGSKLAAWSSVRKERWEGVVEVDGHVPHLLKGTYLRNGPGVWNVGDHSFRHLFDGYATLVGLRFKDRNVILSHRQIESDAYRSSMNNNRIQYREFSEVPQPDNFLAYISELASLFSGASLTDNSNTGVIMLGDGRVVCLMEIVKGSMEINPDILETIGRFEYSDELGGLGRFSIPMDGTNSGKLDSALNPDKHGRGIDMSTINPTYIGKKHRYVYACCAKRPCNFPNTLTKIDLEKKTVKSFHEYGAVLSEPFFIARPGAKEEDDGVVISMVSGKTREGYAVVLDGKTFEEIERLKFPYGLPYGLHGCWVPKA